MWSVVKPLLTELWSFLTTTLPPALEALGKTFGTVFSDIGGFVYNAAVFIATSVKTIRDDFNATVSFIQSIPGQITSAIGNLGSLLYNAGIDLIQGFWNGMSALWGSVARWIQGKVNNLPQIIKDALGIHSPSSVMHGLGENFTLGLQQGIASSWPGLTSMVKGLNVGTPGGLGAPALAMAGAGGGGGYGSGSGASGAAPYVIVQVDGRQLALALAPHLVEQARIRTGLRQ